MMGTLPFEHCQIDLFLDLIIPFLLPFLSSILISLAIFVKYKAVHLIFIVMNFVCWHYSHTKYSCWEDFALVVDGYQAQVAIYSLFGLQGVLEPQVGDNLAVSLMFFLNYSFQMNYPFCYELQSLENHLKFIDYLHMQGCLTPHADKTL